MFVLLELLPKCSTVQDRRMGVSCLLDDSSPSDPLSRIERLVSDFLENATLSAVK